MGYTDRSLWTERAARISYQETILHGKCNHEFAGLPHGKTLLSDS